MGGGGGSGESPVGGEREPNGRCLKMGGVKPSGRGGQDVQSHNDY